VNISIWIGDHATLTGRDPWASTARSHHAPLFAGDAHPRQNLHQASDSDWEEFFRDVDLHELFFAPDVGLIANRPGTVRLTRDHARSIQAAVAKYLAAHRHAEPTYGSGRTQDRHIARLLWLDCWVYRALHHFEEPALHVR